MGLPAIRATDVGLVDAAMVPRAIHALTSDLIGYRITTEVAAYVCLRLPIPARERLTLALLRNDLPTAMRLLRQAVL